MSSLEICTIWLHEAEFSLTRVTTQPKSLFYFSNTGSGGSLPANLWEVATDCPVDFQIPHSWGFWFLRKDFGTGGILLQLAVLLLQVGATKSGGRGL